MLKILTGAKKSTAATTVGSYRDTCIAACQTEEGALALVQELEIKHNASKLVDSELSRRIKRQLDAASNAAQHLALEREFSHRIPQACQRDEDQANAELKIAEKEVLAAGELVASANARVARFTASGAAKRLACDEASNAASSVLRVAEAALEAARDQEDAAEMSRTAEIVIRARREVVATNESNSAALLEVNSFSELADKAREELRNAQEFLAQVDRSRSDAKLALLEVAADRQTLEAMRMHFRLHAEYSGDTRRSYPLQFSDACFFFHKSERALRWDGKPGPCTFSQNQFGGHGGVYAYLKDPDWSAFDLEPMSAPVEGVETAPAL